MAIWIEARFGSMIRSYPLKLEPTTLGRSSKATIKIDDEVLSSIHCRFTLRLGKAYFEDLQSKNGVFLNNSKCFNGFFILGDKLQMGNTHIRLLADKMTPEEKANHSI